MVLIVLICRLLSADGAEAFQQFPLQTETITLPKGWSLWAGMGGIWTEDWGGLCTYDTRQTETITITSWSLCARWGVS